MVSMIYFNSIKMQLETSFWVSVWVEAEGKIKLAENKLAVKTFSN